MQIQSASQWTLPFILPEDGLVTPIDLPKYSWNRNMAKWVIYPSPAGGWVVLVVEPADDDDDDCEKNVLRKKNRTLIPHLIPIIMY